MINRITAITNDALRERWSTVAILTALLTISKAYSIKEQYAIDVQGYFAQVFLALVISFLLALVIHVLLYLVFSPKARSTETPLVIGVPPKSKEQHDAAITAVHDELEAANQAAQALGTTKPLVMATATTKPKKFDLAQELAMPKAPGKKAKRSAKKVVRAKAKPAKKKAAKKKK